MVQGPPTLTPGFLKILQKSYASFGFPCALCASVSKSFRLRSLSGSDLLRSLCFVVVGWVPRRVTRWWRLVRIKRNPTPRQPAHSYPRCWVSLISTRSTQPCPSARNPTYGSEARKASPQHRMLHRRGAENAEKRDRGKTFRYKRQ